MTGDSGMRLFYNTNGFAHHRLDDACRILAEIGYAGVSLTPDVHHLDPYRASAADVEGFKALVSRLGLAVTIESGARFLLDARRKHQPSLLTTSGFARRQDFYQRLIDLARRVGSPLVSIWSGRREADTPPFDQALDLLAERLDPVLRRAESAAVRVVLEPEPGMLVETVAQYRALAARIGPSRLGLTIDTGHLAAVEEPPWDAIVRESASALALVQLDDSPRGRHEHRFFGEGDVDFGSVFAALSDIGFDGPVSIELSRHGHDAPETARRAIEFVRGISR